MLAKFGTTCVLFNIRSSQNREKWEDLKEKWYFM